MADTVESSTLAGDTPARRARQRSAWRLLLGHVRPYRWMILCEGFLGFLGGLASLAEPMVAKLAVDTLGQHRSLAGPAALLAGVTIGEVLLSMGHRVSAGAAQPQDLMRPSAARRPLATRQLGVTGQHRGSLSTHNRADLHGRIHPLQTTVN
jgi:hypothetical protein